MNADTTQPAGALPEPDAYMVTRMIDVGVGMDREPVLSWEPGEEHEDSEPLHAQSKLRAMIAERDAACEERDLWRARVTEAHRERESAVSAHEAAQRAGFSFRDQLLAARTEAAALRRDLVALKTAALIAYESIDADGRSEPEMVALRQALEARPIPPDAPDCTDGDGHVYAAVSRAHATPEQNAAVEASIERVAAFVREGREPRWRPIATAPKDMASYMFLCSGVAMQGFRDATGELCVCQEEGTKRWRSMRRKPTHWMPLPIGPAGTSADGETQP